MQPGKYQRTDLEPLQPEIKDTMEKVGFDLSADFPEIEEIEIGNIKNEKFQSTGHL